MAVQALGRVARKGTSMVLEDEMLACIQFAVRTLAGSLPRQVKAWKDEWPVLIFTDGACEEDGVVVTHGAVLCDVTTGSYFFFGDHVPRSFVEAWTKGGRKQVIYQAELFPIWIAKVTWKHLLNGRQVLWFCDNEAGCFETRLRLLRIFGIHKGDAKLRPRSCLKWGGWRGARPMPYRKR